MNLGPPAVVHLIVGAYGSRPLASRGTIRTVGSTQNSRTADRGDHVGAGTVKRRENGLSADAYAPLIDLIPQLADELLGVLRQAGIAAYALLEEPTEDPEALDRVYVDAAHQREAEDLLHDNVLRDRISTTETLPPPVELDD